MSNTDTGRIKLGKKVYVEETEIIDDTENKSEDSDLPVSMISRKIVADKNNMAIYVHTRPTQNNSSGSNLLLKVSFC